MITFGKIAGGTPASVSAMTEYLLTTAATHDRSGDRSHAADYYQHGMGPDGTVLAMDDRRVAENAAHFEAWLAGTAAPDFNRLAEHSVSSEWLLSPEAVKDRLLHDIDTALAHAASDLQPQARALHGLPPLEPAPGYLRGISVDALLARKELVGSLWDVAWMAAEYRADLADSGAAMSDGRGKVVVRPDLHPIVALGLGIDATRTLTPDQFSGLLVGRRTDGEPVEGKKYSKERAIAVDPKTGERKWATPIGSYDFTVSPAKSVTLAYTFAGEVEQAQIFNCHIEAAREAVAYIATEIGQARLGDGGEDGWEPGHVAWTEVTHYQTRPISVSMVDGALRVERVEKDKASPGDPDLHTHFVIPNAVFCESGRVGSLDTAAIQGFLFEADGYYHARLGEKLRNAGFAVELDERTGSAKMPVIAQENCDLFSKRRKGGEVLAQRLASEAGENWDELSEEQKAGRIDRATKNFRERKNVKQDGAEDLLDWKQQAKEAGWEIPKSFQFVGPKLPELTEEQRHEKAYGIGLPWLAEKLEHRSVVPHWDLRLASLRGLVETGCKGLEDIKAITTLMRRDGVTQYGERTAIVWGQETGKRYTSVTTALHESDEQEFVRLAVGASRDKSGSIPQGLLRHKIQESGLDFSDEHGKRQRQVIELMGAAGRVGVAVGTAGSGKAQPDTARVLTPTGFRLMGELAVGDFVVCPDGSMAPVIGVFPQGEKEIFRVGFEDGRSTECCDDHLWRFWCETPVYETGKSHALRQRLANGQWRVRPLSDLRKVLETGGRASRRIGVPLVSACAIDSAPQALPVPPYTLGALLGDGSLGYNGIKFTSADQQIIDRILVELPDYQLTPGGGYDYTLRMICRANHNQGDQRGKSERSLAIPRLPRGRIERLITHDGVTKPLRAWAKDHGMDHGLLRDRIVRYGWTVPQALGLESRPAMTRTSSPIQLALSRLGLRDTRSHTKFIPDIYKHGSVAQRLALIQGLLDTDGSIEGNHGRGTYATFTSTSERMAKDVQQVAWSLGAVASLAPRQTRCSYKGVLVAGLPSYRVSIRHPDIGQFFYLPRKKLVASKTSQWSGRLLMCGIEPLGRRPARCISIGHPDGLYITDDYIVTHNTEMLKPLCASWLEMGRDVHGASLAWRQTDELVKAGIDRRNLKAFSVLIDTIKKGDVKLTENSVVCVDELGLLGTRQALQLLRAREKYGFTVVALGDDKQCSSIEAGAVIDLFRRALGAEQVPEILTTKRQQTEREQEIVGLLRAGEAAKALDMKRSDGTAELAYGGREGVIKRVAALWAERLQATGLAPTISAPTNSDAHQIGEAVRAERRKLGEIGADVHLQKATDGDREYTLRLAVGDRVKLFQSTKAYLGEGTRRDGRKYPIEQSIGRNGSVVEVVKADTAGVTLKAADGRVGTVKWANMPSRGGRTMLAYGYATTIHTSQGSTAEEHILALPSGSASVTGAAGYTASTRHRKVAYLISSEAAERIAVKESRPINDAHDITLDDKWANVAKNFVNQRKTDSALDMLEKVGRVHRGAVKAFHNAVRPDDPRKPEGPSHVGHLVERLKLDRLMERVSQTVTRVQQAFRHEHSGLSR